MCQQCVVYISVLSPDRAPVGSNVGRFVGQLLPLPPSSAFTGLGNVWLSDRPFTSAGRDCASAAFSSIVYAVRKYIHLQCPPAIPTDERWMTFCQQFARTRGGGGGGALFLYFISCWTLVTPVPGLRRVCHVWVLFVVCGQFVTTMLSLLSRALRTL